MATKLRESHTAFEERFAAAAVADRARRDDLRRQIFVRSQQRQFDRNHQRGTVRFVVLALALVATAVLVTVAMFEALLLVMG